VPRSEKGPRLSLVPKQPLAKSVEAARVVDLGRWVQAFRDQYSDLWPAPGTGVQGPAGTYRRRYSWPECWTAHVSLVIELRCLKRWTEAIEEWELDIAEAMGGGFDQCERSRY